METQYVIAIAVGVILVAMIIFYFMNKSDDDANDNYSNDYNIHVEHDIDKALLRRIMNSIEDSQLGD